ncbi:hypothetical protein ABZ953_26225 [Streptomyces sp. NPDC046465]|uniref:hypothetical protein n=1 Tax=Streptomyces sp. NPDC046465 TaxID=3155810 RepID=UPI0033D608FA
MPTAWMPRSWNVVDPMVAGTVRAHKKVVRGGRRGGRARVPGPPGGAGGRVSS